MQAMTRVRDVLEVLTRWTPQLLSDGETLDLIVRGPVALDPRELVPELCSEFMVGRCEDVDVVRPPGLKRIDHG